MSRINPRKELEGMIPYQVGESLEELKKRYGVAEFYKMSDNENPYGTSPLVKEAIQKYSSLVHLYPDGNSSLIVNALSEYHQQPVDRFVIGNGSDEVIRLIARAYINSGDEAVMADATFPRYQTNVLLEGGRAVTVPLKNGIHDLGAMQEAITESTKMVFVCNPNNPTGTITGKLELYKFIDSIPENILIIVDEAYAEYVTSIDYLETVQLIDKYPNLVVLRTFSKIYGLAGLRIGYGVMHPDIAAELKKAKDVFNVNHLAEMAAVAALSDQKFVSASAANNHSEREHLISELHSAGFAPLPSEANFLFVPLAKSQESIFEAFLKSGILVKMMSLPGFSLGMRVTIGQKEANEAFLRVINSFAIERVV